MNMPLIRYYYFTPETICFALGEKVLKAKYMERVTQGLNNLIDIGVIKNTSENPNYYLIDSGQLYFEDYYTTLPVNDLTKIITYNGDIFKLLRYYSILLNTTLRKSEQYLDAFQSKTNILGCYSQKKLSELSGVSEKSILAYNKFLEKEKIIFIYRYNDFSNKDYKYLPNIYGRYINKEYITAYGNKNSEFKNTSSVKSTRDKSNSKRSLAQKYNAICNFDKDYTQEETIEIYSYVLSENKKNEKMFEDTGWDKYLERIKDVTIFDKYDFIKIT